MAWTQTDAAEFTVITRGLDPRCTTARPTAQRVLDALVTLATKAEQALGRPKSLGLSDERQAELRQLVDDLYRTEVADEARVAVASWHFGTCPDFEGIAAAVVEVSGGTVYAQEYEDAQDDWVLVVSNRPLTDTVARAAWEASR